MSMSPRCTVADDDDEEAVVVVDGAKLITAQHVIACCCPVEGLVNNSLWGNKFNPNGAA